MSCSGEIWYVRQRQNTQLWLATIKLKRMLKSHNFKIRFWTFRQGSRKHKLHRELGHLLWVPRPLEWATSEMLRIALTEIQPGCLWVKIHFQPGGFPQLGMVFQAKALALNTFVWHQGVLLPSTKCRKGSTWSIPMQASTKEAQQQIKVTLSLAFPANI